MVDDNDDKGWAWLVFDDDDGGGGNGGGTSICVMFRDFLLDRLKKLFLFGFFTTDEGFFTFWYSLESSAFEFWEEGKKCF